MYVWLYVKSDIKDENYLLYMLILYGRYKNIYVYVDLYYCIYKRKIIFIQVYQKYDCRCILYLYMVGMFGVVRYICSVMLF